MYLHTHTRVSSMYKVSKLNRSRKKKSLQSQWSGYISYRCLIKAHEQQMAQQEDREIPLSFPPNTNKYLHCIFTINKRHHPSIATQMQTSRIKMNALRLNGLALVHRNCVLNTEQRSLMPESKYLTRQTMDLLQ